MAHRRVAHVAARRLAGAHVEHTHAQGAAGQQLAQQLERDTAPYSAAEIIFNEAERMAEIVRKIGKITKYETKSYVGRARILDLDRSAPASAPKGGEEPLPSQDSRELVGASEEKPALPKKAGGNQRGE